MTGTVPSWRAKIRSLWLRVYVLLFVVYQTVAFVGVIVWGVLHVRSGYAFGSLVGAYTLLIVPGGFGVTLLVSIPAAGVWLVLARTMGWPIAVPVQASFPRCASCGYDASGLARGLCPECGRRLDSIGETGADHVNQLDDAGGAVR